VCSCASDILADRVNLWHNFYGDSVKMSLVRAVRL
jgi:hypothetical protein